MQPKRFSTGSVKSLGPKTRQTISSWRKKLQIWTIEVSHSYGIAGFPNYGGVGVEFGLQEMIVGTNFIFMQSWRSTLAPMIGNSPSEVKPLAKLWVEYNSFPMCDVHANPTIIWYSQHQHGLAVLLGFAKFLFHSLMVFVNVWNWFCIS